MRLNRYLALHLGIGRRKADELIRQGYVTIDERPAELGTQVEPGQVVAVSGKIIASNAPKPILVMLHKPVGVVSSRDGQGSPSVYSLLPDNLQHLKIAGRLDKHSSGLLLLSSSGMVVQQTTHPSQKLYKQYYVRLQKPLAVEDFQKITGSGVSIDANRPSSFALYAGHKSDLIKKESLPKSIYAPQQIDWTCILQEGRNRQIRKTFEALHYSVVRLHRVSIGRYTLGSLKPGAHRVIQADTPKNP